MKRSLHKCSLTLKHIGHTPTINGFLNSWKHCYRFIILLFTKYKCTWPTPIIMSLLAAVPAKMSALNSLMQQNACHRKTKGTFADLLPCYCYVIKNNSRTIHSRLSQPTSAGKGGNMSELQAHHRMTI